MAKNPGMAIVKGVLSYPHLFEKVAVRDSQGNPQGNPAYSCSVIIDKKDAKTLEALKAAIDHAIRQGKEKFNWTDAVVNGKKFNYPLKDADEEKVGDKDYDKVYKGKMFINARNQKDMPQIVDIHKDPLEDERDIYAGCLVRVSVVAFAFDKGVNKGISLSLHNVQKLADGERLGGGATNASDDFDDVDDETMVEANAFASAAAEAADYL